MARRPRINFPGAVHHVHDRGNRKCVIFEDDIDRELFMQLIVDVHRRFAVRFYSVCLMGTHYHAVMETPRANLSDAMHRLNGEFTTRTNIRHDRTGHLFEGRFRSHVVERDRYLRRVIRYLAWNPVAGGLVKEPGDWPWSTYLATAGRAPCPEWLSLDWLPWAFDAPTVSEAQAKFVEYVNRKHKREALDWNKIAFGTTEFEAAMEEVAYRRRTERPLPRATPPIPPPPLEKIFVNVDSIAYRNRLVEVAHKKHGYRLSEISRHLNLHSGAASRIVRRLERRKPST
jgi:putative transposase